jgi:hypothetical protein
MNIFINDKIDSNLWNKFINNKIFFRYEWLYIIQNTYKLEPYFILCYQDEKFALIASFKTSKGYISLPFVSYSGFCSNDEYILKQLDNNENITIVETSEETALYTKATLSNDNIEVKIFEKIIEEKQKNYKSMSINYRLERLPYETRKDLFDFVNNNLDKDGIFYITSRTNNIFYTIFYKLFIKLLGDNISKTAIYSFFGPFKPLNVNETEKILKKYNFIIEKKRYLFIPPIFESIAQLMHQYKKSKGENFMHRIEVDTPLSSFFKYVTKIQLKMNINFFGSIVVFKIKKGTISD